MITACIKDIDLIFQTQAGVFSPSGIDAGTLAMLSVVEFRPDDKVLDLGCGYGVVGILAARLIGADRVVMTDIDPEAVALAQINAGLNGISAMRIFQGDGFAAISDRDFSLILSNPPYHTDFSVAKAFIEQAWRHLQTGGRLIMVTKRLAWYRNKIRAVFGGVRVSPIDDYYVFSAEKRICVKPGKNAKTMQHSKKLQRKIDRKNREGSSS
ncbi:MAG TPA: methyltransferase [Clostridiales bacterium]|nr:methyltransferase [Clostridiales bacterium]